MSAPIVPVPVEPDEWQTSGPKKNKKGKGQSDRRRDGQRERGSDKGREGDKEARKEGRKEGGR